MQSSEILTTLASELPFWGKLSKAEADLLISGVKPILYKQGDSIHRPSNECIGVLLVKSGELRTYLLSENGKEVTLFRLDSGDACILSASCLLSNITFDVFIDAQQDTEVLLISQRFRTAPKQQPPCRKLRTASGGRPLFGCYVGDGADSIYEL